LISFRAHIEIEIKKAGVLTAAILKQTIYGNKRFSFIDIIEMDG
jgi:hypothetical protein